MNINKIAFISASWLFIGATALAGPSFAADSPAKKPTASQPMHDMKAHGDEPEDGGMMCDHKGGMMGGNMGGNMGGKMCDHHKGGKMCDHEGGMMGGMCGHEGGMMGCMMEGHGGGKMMGSPRMNEVMSLDLNDEQRSKINKLSDELKHNNWATKGLIMDESAKLRDLYAADKRDPSAIGKEYQKIFDLQRQMIEATITTQNRIEELLTPDQRAQLKKMHSGKIPMHEHSMHDHPMMHDNPMH